jgi:acetyl esterase/lipase
MMPILATYEGKRRLYPTIARPDNPPLNTRYIRRKWLDVPYADGCPRALMDIYLPNDGAGPFPVILFAHGGGYFFGDKGNYETYPPLEGLKRGYAVCAINYTLSGEALFPRQIQEGKAALRFIRANAATYNLDASCIIAWGMSAGANLVAMLATTGHERFPELEDLSMGNPDQPHNVDACMIWFCPTELAPLADFALADVEPAIAFAGPESVWTWYFGMNLEDVPSELLAMANPETHVSAAAPPFVIQHARPDQIVPYVQSIRLADKLKAAIGENKVRLTIFDDYVHADRRFETMHNCSIVLDQLEELPGGGR